MAMNETVLCEAGPYERKVVVQISIAGRTHPFAGPIILNAGEKLILQTLPWEPASVEKGGDNDC